MSNTFLFLGILLIFIVYTFVTKKDYSSPCILFCSGFLISSLFLMINTNTWKYTISGKTIFIVLSSLIVFGIGSFLAGPVKFSFSQSHTFVPILSKQSKQKSIKTVLTTVAVICLLVRFLDLYLTIGSVNVFSGVLGVYRNLEDSSRLSSLISFCTPAISACVILMSVELVNKIRNKKKGIAFPIIIIILGLFYFALSSSRIEILYTFVYLIAYLLIVLKINNKKLNAKTVVIILVLSALLFVSFFLAGYLTGKSQNQVSMFDNVSLYAGSSIGTFDSWIRTYKYDGRNFGITIFRGLSNLLAWFKIKLPISYDTNLGFRSIGEMVHTSNVYSCLAELIIDVGYIGMLVILFFEGFLLTKLYKVAIKKFNYGKTTLLYLYIYLVPLITFSSIAERIFRTFLTISTLVFIFVIWFLNRLQINKRSK